MTPQQILINTYETSFFVLSKYLDDLSDADLMHRPGIGCNHLNWQLGHLISSEPQLINMVLPGKGATMPDGFIEKYVKGTGDNDSPDAFATKQELVRLMKLNREAAIAAFNAVSDAQLDAAAPERMRPMFPTVGSVMILVATHCLMHAGQFVPVRRALKKPVVI